MKPSQKSKIVVQTMTWTRDSNGLFDYESKSLAKKSFIARTTSQLIRVENEVVMKEDDYQLTPDATGLGWIVENENSFIVKPYQTSDLLWMVVPPVRTMKHSEGYPMSEGDVLRLGRVSFSVRQVCPTGKDNPAFAFKAPQDVAVMPVDTNQQGEKMPCRICLSDTQTPEDPLISPCKCAGTMQFIHLKCLREWLQSRLNIKQTGIIMSYYWKSLDCELCKVSLPSTVMIGGALVELVDIHKPDTPFIVLEDITRERDRAAGLGIHVLSMPPGAVINIGRGHESDIRIQDISVSRLHASIQLSQDTFRISDRKSKFGTLVQVKRWISLFPGVDISLQISRTVVNIKMKRDVRFCAFFCSCCLKSTKVLPGVGELTVPDKAYEVNDRSAQLDDGSFSRLMVHHQPNLSVQAGATEEVPRLQPRLIAQDFMEAEERPTTRARSVGETSMVIREVSHP